MIKGLCCLSVGRKKTRREGGGEPNLPHDFSAHVGQGGHFRDDDVGDVVVHRDVAGVREGLVRERVGRVAAGPLAESVLLVVRVEPFRKLDFWSD